MKIRNGFISNSSSSNFLVGFARYPKSVDDVIDMVFGDKKVFRGTYGGEWNVREVAEIIFNNINKQIPNNLNTILSRMAGITYEYSNANVDLNENDFIENRLRDKNFVIDFMSKNKGAYFYCISISDNDGDLSSAMEHCDLFDNLPHLINSLH